MYIPLFLRLQAMVVRETDPQHGSPGNTVNCQVEALLSSQIKLHGAIINHYPSRATLYGAT